MRPRMSRIFYEGKYYDYPLQASNALRNLGVIEAVRCVGSYALAKVHPPKDQTNYENWLVARFGWRLYRRFFKTYTEKVWGVPVNQMPADWAAQRVKGLTLGKAIANALLPAAQPEGDHEPHRGVPVPEVRAGDDVGALPRPRRRARRRRPDGRAPRGRARHRRRRRRRDDQGPRRRPRRPSRGRGDLDDADARAGRRDRPAGARRRAGRGRGAALPGLPHRRARRAADGVVPGQLDLHPRRGRPGRAHPELRLVVALPRQGREGLPRPRVLRLRG